MVWMLLCSVNSQSQIWGQAGHTFWRLLWQYVLHVSCFKGFLKEQLRCYTATFLFDIFAKYQEIRNTHLACGQASSWHFQVALEWIRFVWEHSISLQTLLTPQLALSCGTPWPAAPSCGTSYRPPWSVDINININNIQIKVSQGPQPTNKWGREPVKINVSWGILLHPSTNLHPSSSFVCLGPLTGGWCHLCLNC